MLFGQESRSMDLIQQLLQVSAKLYKHLSAFPSGEERTEYIDEVNGLLDERGILVKQLREQNFQYDETDETHVTLYKLDKGIRERLDLLFNEVKADLKKFNDTKKYEKQYINPYASVRAMDGRYYDKRK
jgi:flagellar protein FliT